MKRKNWIILFVLIGMMAGCKSCTDELVKDVVALGSAPMVQVRIAGLHYLTKSGVSQDQFTPSGDGFLCVTHVPDCKGWIFSSGNSGTDKFFDAAHPLPPGAAVVGVMFTQYWPVGICASGNGGVGDYGSYGARLSGGGPHPTDVDWNNSCQSDFAGKDLHYKVSFIISMIQGTDLGEPTFTDMTATGNACTPAGFQPTHPDNCATPAPQCSVLHSSGQDALTIPKAVVDNEIVYPYNLSVNTGCSGTLLSLTNPPVNGMTVGIKTASGQVTLGPGATTTAAQMTTLFGKSNPSLPLSMTFLLPTGQTPAGIYMVFNYTYLQ